MPLLNSATPLVSVLQADTALADTVEWTGLATDEIKTDHLIKASLWVQTRYTCADVDFTDLDALPESIKDAVVLLAVESVNGNLYSDAQGLVVNGEVKKELLKAGPVTQELQYAEGATTVQGGGDPFPFITDLLDGVCVFTGPKYKGQRKGGTVGVVRS